MSRMKPISGVLIVICLGCLMLSGVSAAPSNDTYTGNNSFRYDVVCGNGICEVTENSANCPNDCSKEIIKYQTNIVSPTLKAGSSEEYFLRVENNKNISVRVGISMKGGLATYFDAPNSTLLDKLGSERLFLNITIPENITEDKLSGRLVLEVEGQEASVNKLVSIPVQIRIFESGKKYSFDVDVPKKTYKKGQELYILYEVISNAENASNVSIRTKVSSIGNETVLYNFTRRVRISPGFTKTSDVLPLNKSSLGEGQYYLRSTLVTDDRTLHDQANFFIRVVFWTPFRINLALFFIGLVGLAFGGGYGYRKYVQWRLSKMRYIPPEFDKIPKKRDSNICVGKIAETSRRAYLDPNDLTRHALVAGSTGSGKSVSASVIVEEILLKNIPVIVFDPTCQWTGFVKQLKDKNILEAYKHFNLSEEDAKSFKGLIYNVEQPIFEIDFKKYMHPGEITVFNLSNLQPGQYDQAVQNVISKMFEYQWEESSELQMLVVFDEVHRLLEKYGGTGGYVALEKACREFRKWGIGMIMASQVSADFKQAVAGNIMTEFQLNTKSMEDIQKIAHKYGESYSTKVSRQGIGVAMVQNASYNNGKPWFIHLRPPLHDPHKISQEELEMYGKYSAKVDELEKKVAKAEEKGKEAGNIKLELKLTKDKLKEGHFKMVEIYISNLEKNIDNL